MPGIRPFAALAVLALGAALAAPAAAQEAPADLASPAPAVPAEVAQSRASLEDVRRSETIRDSLITIDAAFSDQAPLGNDQKIRPGNPTNQLVIGGTAVLRVAPGLGIFYRRINHDNVSGATNGSGFGSWSYDIEGDYGLRYAASRDLRFEGFWKYRYRTYSPNAGDATAFNNTAKTPAGPRIERGLMFNTEYRFGPRTRIGRPFLVSEELQYYVHHLDYTILTNPAYAKTGMLNGQVNGSDTTLFETHVYWYPVVWGQKKFQPYIGWENKPTYFDNNLQPGFQNRVRWGARTVFSPTLSLDTYVKNDHGYPASPGASHNVTLFGDLLVHLKY